MQSTLTGDMVTLIGAITIIGYLEVGQSLRRFMPLMVYAVPVTGERRNHHALHNLAALPSCIAEFHHAAGFAFQTRLPFDTFPADAAASA